MAANSPSREAVADARAFGGDPSAERRPQRGCAERPWPGPPLCVLSARLRGTDAAVRPRPNRASETADNDEGGRRSGSARSGKAARRCRGRSCSAAGSHSARHETVAGGPASESGSSCRGTSRPQPLTSSTCLAARLPSSSACRKQFKSARSMMHYLLFL